MPSLGECVLRLGCPVLLWLFCGPALAKLLSPAQQVLAGEEASPHPSITPLPCPSLETVISCFFSGNASPEPLSLVRDPGPSPGNPADPQGLGVGQRQPEGAGGILCPGLRWIC